MNCDSRSRAPSSEGRMRRRGAYVRGPVGGRYGISDRGGRTLREVWSRLAARLRDSGAADAEIEAEVLLRHTLGLDRAEYFAALSEPVPSKSVATADGYTNRRAEGEPLAYITGRREFYGLEFAVDERVLVPRQETELLVDLALEACAPRGGERIVVADVGTGSGAIAVVLASKLSRAVVYAMDASPGPLEVASANAERNGVRERVRLLQGDLLGPLPELADVIVSNPPYIPTEGLSGLPREVRREPAVALDGGPDGTTVISRLLEQAPSFLGAGTQFSQALRSAVHGDGAGAKRRYDAHGRALLSACEDRGGQGCVRSEPGAECAYSEGLASSFPIARLMPGEDCIDSWGGC